MFLDRISSLKGGDDRASFQVGAPMDHGSDVDMTETEYSTAAQVTASSANGTVWELLALARQLIGQGKPTQALQAVVMAVRSDGGDQAVFQSLHRACELYRSRLQANESADQLASLFAECAIAEAHPSASQAQTLTDNVGPQRAGPEAHTASILAESGRMQIVMDAFSDGSSFICLQCGGLVSNHRKDEHYAYWCCQAR